MIYERHGGDTPAQFSGISRRAVVALSSPSLVEPVFAVTRENMEDVCETVHRQNLAEINPLSAPMLQNCGISGPDRPCIFEF